MFVVYNFLIWLPLAAALLLMSTAKENTKLHQLIAYGSTFLSLLLSILLYFQIDFQALQVLKSTTVAIPWIRPMGIFYRLGIDGLSYPLILLNSILFFLCIFCSRSVHKSTRSYFALLLALQSTIIGVFLSLDFFLFYIFWEAMLIPMFFLIAIWGGEQRLYAATKFILYTFTGSIFMLIAIIALYYLASTQGHAPHSFTISDFYAFSNNSSVTFLGLHLSTKTLLFWMLFFGFAVKVPVFPFHTWLPHAHVQAPTAVSVILAGVLLKMGTYGFLRILFPIFPGETQIFSGALAFLGVVSIIYGALCALAQEDMKKLVAYSSISHMGFVLLGLASLTIAGVNGAVMQMFNHGTSAAMMFMLVGIIYERSHHRWIVRPDGTRGFTGLAIQMPVYAKFFIIGLFGALGLPGLSGFVSEYLIFLGAFPEFPMMTVLAGLGLLFGAAYLLYMYKRLFFGEPTTEVKAYPDLDIYEKSSLIPLAFLIIILGVFPGLLGHMTRDYVGNLLAMMLK